ncbi:hypothetical protein ACQF4J_38190 [Streptomyces sp. C1-1]|uniref:hypothetical protein n=1 Tax=Streptomyces sp. C1-1 TaxID=3231173 RepID=UPI003D0733CC
MPDRLRHPDDPVRGRPGDLRPLTRLFLRGEDGRRPVHGGQTKFQQDPHRRDPISFHAYFHGDNAGIGAAHQAGWTGLVATLMTVFGTLTPGDLRTDPARSPKR